MNLTDQTNAIYEKCRKMLFDIELVTKEIKKISNPRLRNRISEIFNTCQADLLILNYFLIDIMNCESVEEIEFRIQDDSEFSELVS